MLQGESPPPPLFFTVWGFVNFEVGCCCSRRYFADDLQTPSLRRPKWVLLIQSRPKWVLLVLQTTCRRQAYVDPSGSCSSRVDPSGSCSSCRRPPDAKPTSTQVGPAHPESTQVGPARPADDLQTPGLRRPKWVLLIQSRPKWVLLVLQTTSRRQAYVDPSGSCSSCRRPPDTKPTSTQVGPTRTEFDPAVPGPSRRRSFDSPQRSSDHSSCQGSDTPPRKRRRLSGNSSEDEDPSSQNRQQRDDQQDEEDNFRPASLDLLLNYITKKFLAASQPLVQPSSKRFHVMESAGLVDESSQQSSNLAWFGHMRSACDYAQR